MQTPEHCLWRAHVTPLILAMTGALLFPMTTKAEQCRAATPASLSEHKTDLVIGQIAVRTGDLFDLDDPGQGQFVHSAANAMHWDTRSRTVVAVLPFHSGDAFSPDLLLEAERLLRDKRYLRDASVVAHRICGNQVDVDVSTIDNWTLTPSVSFGSAGGENRYSLEIQDLNVLGLGKELMIRQSRYGDRESSTFLYSDDNVLGSRYRLHMELGDTDDGERYLVQGGLPFYADDASRSWWASLESDTKSFGNSEGSDERIPVKTEQATFSMAKALQNSNLPYSRLGLGLRMERQITDLSFEGRDEGDEITHDFEEIYPFITAQWSQSDWIKRQDYKNLRANEDINLGLDADLELGLIMSVLGNDVDAVRLDVNLANGWYVGDDALHTLGIEQTHYFSSNDRSKYALSARYQYFRWVDDNNQLDLRLTGETRRGYSPLHDYSVGGDQGLRAYRTDHQRGEQRLLGMAEVRHITSWSPWSLLHAAVAGFVEVGRAWSDGENPETLADAGVGLLLSSTRSSRAAINRFDLSVPLVDGHDVDDFQIFIGSTINF